MVARVRNILAAVAFVAGVAAFVLGCVLGGASLVLEAAGHTGAQLAVAGVSEMLISHVFLVAGAGLLVAAARTVRRGREALTQRLVFGLLSVCAGTCWIIGSALGLIRPEILRVAFASS